MKTFKFKMFGKPMEVYFIKDAYAVNDDLYVGAFKVDGDYYGDISKCLPMSPPLEEKEIYADTNNSSEIIKAMLKAELLIDTHETTSCGMCIYPKYKLTDKFEEYVKVM